MGTVAPVHESDEDIERLQRVIDRSYEQGGRHLLSIHAPEHRLTAAQVAERLAGMRLLSLATAGRSGRPYVGPVDGIFYKGAFHFGSAPDSLRFRHIRVRPQVSATHLPGEELAVTVHGTAVPIDVNSPEHAGFRQALLEIYVPRYGESWADILEKGAQYARIEPERMFTFHMEA